MDASTRFESRTVGAMPVIKGFMDRLGLDKVIDDNVPWKGNVALGKIVSVLVMNRLLRPMAMYRIGEWARDSLFAQVLGVAHEALNDDVLGRGLERLAKHRVPALRAVTLAAVKEFKVDLSEVHYDISTLELYGKYADAISETLDTGKGPSPVSFPATPFPTYGRTKSGRDNMRQIQFGLTVTGDGAIPVNCLPLDGNAAEARTHVGNLQEIRKLLPKKSFLYMGDSKLDTPENLAAIVRAKGTFLCAGAFTPKLKELCREILHLMQPLDYCSKKDAQRPPEDRDQYRGHEVTDTMVGTIDGKTIKVRHRLLFIHSSAKAARQQETRQRHIDKVTAEFKQVEKIAGKYSMKDDSAIRRRLETARGLNSEGKLFEYEVTGSKKTLKVRWWINEQKLKELKELDGFFVLRTNQSKKRSINRVLHKYRSQSKVEKRISQIKGPLAVAPAFLEKPERLAGLMVIISIALTIVALMEREVRQNLDGEPMYGLYPENRPCPSPTGTSLIQAFENLAVVVIHERGETYHRLAQFSEVQRRITKLLNISDAVLRTFKRGCGT